MQSSSFISTQRQHAIFIRVLNAKRWSLCTWKVALGWVPKVNIHIDASIYQCEAWRELYWFAAAESDSFALHFGHFERTEYSKQKRNGHLNYGSTSTYNKCVSRQLSYFVVANVLNINSVRCQMLFFLFVACVVHFDCDAICHRWHWLVCMQEARRHFHELNESVDTLLNAQWFQAHENSSPEYVQSESRRMHGIDHIAQA